MKHALKIKVSKESPGDGIVSCKTITLRERLIKRLLGEKRKVTVIIPGNSVESLSIQELSGDGENYERRKSK